MDTLEGENMKIIVDSIPKRPEDHCLFKSYDCDIGWMCKFKYRLCKLERNMPCDCLTESPKQKEE